MFKVKPAIVFGVNILLMLLSWIFYKFPQGDEYLVLFVIPLVFMVAPYVMGLRLMGLLLLANLSFLIFYYFLGALNIIDIVVISALFIAAAAANYITRTLKGSFTAYQKANVTSQEKKYGGIVDELDVVDRRGRKIENELNRISRIYEITKQLAPVLKFEDLLDTLFYFLEENFKFKTAHLLVFNKGKFSRGISKSVGDRSYYEDADMVLDYAEVVDYMKEQDLKELSADNETDKNLLRSINARSDTFFAYSLIVGDKISAILAIEGASKTSFGRFRILIPQIALEFRKVELYEQVQQMSIIDGLTEVYQRRYLMARLDEEVDRSQRLNLTFSIGMVDVDHFKRCNDEHGHLVGDTVLKQIADRLKKSVREIDMIARYGGEEFCVALPETSKELALTVAERLRRSIASKEIKAFDESVRTTVSVGIATYPEDGQDVATLIDKADNALYKAKRKGRNMVCSS